MTSPNNILLVEDNADDRELTIMEGVNAYVVKPIEFGSFSEAVKQLGLFWLMTNDPARLAEPRMNAHEFPGFACWIFTSA